VAFRTIEPIGAGDMKLTVGRVQDGVSLELGSCANLRELEVRLNGMTVADLDAVLSALDLGSAADVHAWLVVSRLERLGRLAVEGSAPSWPADFAAMISYADSHGWLSKDGERVRAHCVGTTER
jgi:hypothetical protein